MSHVGAIALCGVVSLTAAAAQTPSAPGGAQAPRGTAAIIGQVVSGSSSDGIPESIVTLNLAPSGAAAAGRSARPGAPPPLRRIMTGIDGRFVFYNLPPGTYQVSAARAGYSAHVRVTFVSTLGSAVVASEPAHQLVTLAEHEVAAGVRLRLRQDASIAGTVFDETGEPAAGIAVQAARRVMTAGRPRFLPLAPLARTDSRGVYRLFGLPPGDYLVLVPQMQVTMPASLTDRLIRSVATGEDMTVMEVLASGLGADAAIVSGLRVGPLMVSSKAGTVPIVGDDGRLRAYPTTFYPGTAAVEHASVVDLADGERRVGVDFRLQLVHTMRISGTARWPDGRPYPNLTVRLVAATDPSAPNVEIDIANAVTDAGGRFDMLALPPGQFVLRAAVQPRPGSAAAGAGPAGAADAPPLLFASAAVSLGGTDIDELLLQLAEGPRITGLVEFESATGRKPPSPGALALSFTPADGRWPGLVLSLPDRPTLEDGRFTTRGRPPGRYSIGLVDGGWMLKSATFAGIDVLDAPMEIRDRPAGELVLTLTDRLPTVGGTVVATNAADRADTTVVLFPADYRAWIANGMAARRLHVGPVDRNGTFMLSNVPAGEYLVVAIAQPYDGDPEDPAFIARLAPLATRLAVDLATAPLSLRRVKVGR